MTERVAHQGARYVLVIRVPREKEVEIEDAYLGLAGLTKPVISYHVTLIGPFRLRNAPSETLEQMLVQACQRWEPFDVRIHGVEAFESPGDHVVYLDVVTPERVIVLRGFLLKQVLPILSPENERVAQFTLAHYHPHVTLGLGLSDAQLGEILAAAEKRSVDLSFTADCIWLVCQSGTSPWRYVRSFAFGDRDPSCCDATSRHG